MLYFYIMTNAGPEKDQINVYYFFTSVVGPQKDEKIWDIKMIDK